MVGLIDIDELNKMLDRVEKLNELYSRISKIWDYNTRPDNLVTGIFAEIESIRQKLDSRQILDEVKSW